MASAVMTFRVRYSWWPHFGPTMRNGVMRIWLLPVLMRALWERMTGSRSATFWDVSDE